MEPIETDIDNSLGAKQRPAKRKKRGGKPIQEVQIGRMVPGTDVLAKQYWDFMGVDTHDQDPMAEPDMLTTDDSPYSRPLSERGQLQFEAIKEAFKDLTPRQQIILQFLFDGVWNEELGQREYSQEAIANQLKISQPAVAAALTLIRTKVQRSYEKLMTEEES